MKIKLGLLFGLFTISVFSQVSVDDISFSSNFEKVSFSKSLNNDAENFTDLLFSIDYDSIALSSLNSKITSIQKRLDSKKIANKSTKKKIKSISKFLETYFYKDYKYDGSFKELLENNKYNATSAAMLGAILLDYYKVPYSINYANGSVYLLIFNNGNKLILQPSRLPEGGGFSYDHQFKQAYINYLAEKKLISSTEKESYSVDELFKTHFSANNTINKTQLAGVSYYQRAKILATEDKNSEALIFLEKALFLNPDNQTNHLYYATLAQVINTDLVAKKYNGKQFAKFLNISHENQLEKNQVLNTFRIAADEFLIKTQNLEKFETLFSEFKNNVNEDVEFDDFQELYHEALANYFYLKRDYEKTIHHLSEGLLINPNNLQTKNNIENTFSGMISVITDTDEQLNKFNTYFEVFPFLRDNEYYQLSYTGSYLRAIYQAYMRKDKEDGLVRILEFEQVMKEAPDLKIDPNFVDGAYITAATSYEYKEVNTMFSILEKGLKLAPESKALLERYNELKKYKAYRKQKAVERNAYANKKTLSEKIKEYLKSCWSVTEIEKLGKEIEKNQQLEFTINLKGIQKAQFSSETKNFEGEFSIRYKSKLLYLIPKNNRSKYLIYKIVDIDAYELALRPFVNNKLTNRLLTLTPCKKVD
ncbi:tetratricopeptide repeat protein [Wenyingzhuangia sp. IMCC45574]